MSTFSCSYLPWIYLFLVTSVEVFFPLCCWVDCLLIEFLEVFIYSRYKFLVIYVIWKYIITTCEFYFYSLNSVFCSADILNFEVQFFILWIAFLVLYLRYLPNISSQRFYFIFFSESFIVSCLDMWYLKFIF